MIRAVEVILRFLRSGNGPLSLAAPRIRARNQDLYRLFIYDAVWNSLEPIVEPTQLDRIKIHGRRRTKIKVTNLSDTDQVNPWANNQTMLVAQRFGPVANYSQIIVSSGLLNTGIPSSNVESG
jgi:hypothetical protein